jgi:hypothetical protein
MLRGLSALQVSDGRLESSAQVMAVVQAFRRKLLRRHWELRVTPSRDGETGTYKPTIEDLDRLARFFGKSILEFFPGEDVRTERDGKIDALLRIAKQLNDDDVEELRRFAEFRRAQSVYTKRTPGRKVKK